MEGQSEPFRIRFRVPLTVIPLLVGVAAAIPLWGIHAHLEFFTAATQVLATGAWRSVDASSDLPRTSTRAPSVPTSSSMWLVCSAPPGLGLFFSFRALAVGRAEAPDLAITAGALASSIAAFGVQAFFGTPGIRDAV